MNFTWIQLIIILSDHIVLVWPCSLSTLVAVSWQSVNISLVLNCHPPTVFQLTECQHLSSAELSPSDCLPVDRVSTSLSGWTVTLRLSSSWQSVNISLGLNCHPPTVFQLTECQHLSRAELSPSDCLPVDRVSTSLSCWTVTLRLSSSWQSVNISLGLNCHPPTVFQLTECQHLSLVLNCHPPTVFQLTECQHLSSAELSPSDCLPVDRVSTSLSCWTVTLRLSSSWQSVNISLSCWTVTLRLSSSWQSVNISLMLNCHPPTVFQLTECQHLSHAELSPSDCLPVDRVSTSLSCWTVTLRLSSSWQSVNISLMLNCHPPTVFQLTECQHLSRAELSPSDCLPVDRVSTSLSCWTVTLRLSSSWQSVNISLVLNCHPPTVFQLTECQHLSHAELSPSDCLPVDRVSTSLSCWTVTLRLSSSWQRVNISLMLNCHPPTVFQLTECQHLSHAELSPSDCLPVDRVSTSLSCWTVTLRLSSSWQSVNISLMLNCHPPTVFQLTECQHLSHAELSPSDCLPVDRVSTSLSCWTVTLRLSSSWQSVNISLVLNCHPPTVFQLTECQHLSHAELSPSDCLPVDRVSTSLSCWTVTLRLSSSWQRVNISLMLNCHPPTVFQLTECQHLSRAELSPSDCLPVDRVSTSLSCWTVTLRLSSSWQSVNISLMLNCHPPTVFQLTECQHLSRAELSPSDCLPVDRVSTSLSGWTVTLRLSSSWQSVNISLVLNCHPPTVFQLTECQHLSRAELSPSDCLPVDRVSTSLSCWTVTLRLSSSWQSVNISLVLNCHPPTVFQLTECQHLSRAELSPSDCLPVDRVSTSLSGWTVTLRLSSSRHTIRQSQFSCGSCTAERSCDDV